MKGELYRRWLIDGRDLTLSEFVTERRAEVRQLRAQRRWSQNLGPLMQNMTPEQQRAYSLQQQLGMQNLYRGGVLGGIGSLLGGILGDRK